MLVLKRCLITLCLVFATTVSGSTLLRFKRTHYDWQPPLPTSRPTTTTSTSTTTERPPHVEIVNVTSMLIRDGTARIGADVVMHKEEAEGIGDAGIILWGRPKVTTTTTVKPATNEAIKSSVLSPAEVLKSSSIVQTTTSTTTTTESNIEKIMDNMPTANEDMIRVVKLANDEHYGHGHAKPKFISLVLATMKSVEYQGEETTTKAATTKATMKIPSKGNTGSTTNAPPTSPTTSATTTKTPTSTENGKRSTDKQTTKVEHTTSQSSQKHKEDTVAIASNTTRLAHKTDDVKPIVEIHPDDVPREMFSAPLIASTTPVPTTTFLPTSKVNSTVAPATSSPTTKAIPFTFTESPKEKTTSPRLLIDLLADKTLDQTQTILVEIPIALVTSDAEKTHLPYTPISSA